jgi:hypothetical protein
MDRHARESGRSAAAKAPGSQLRARPCRTRRPRRRWPAAMDPAEVRERVRLGEHATRSSVLGRRRPGRRDGTGTVHRGLLVRAPGPMAAKTEPPPLPNNPPKLVGPAFQKPSPDPSPGRSCRSRPCWWRPPASVGRRHPNGWPSLRKRDRPRCVEIDDRRPAADWAAWTRSPRRVRSRGQIARKARWGRMPTRCAGRCHQPRPSSMGGTLARAGLVGLRGRERRHERPSPRPRA